MEICRQDFRPVPPHFSVQTSEFRYGLCVDALVEEVWWEGVIFDHHESSEERTVFFPDQGDEQLIITVDRLRLTQDWDGVSGSWKPRGQWLLLQVLQGFEHEGGLPVSIREIWYDLRATRAFQDQIKSWTSGTKDIWNALASELIRELWSVIIGTHVPLTQLDGLVQSIEVSGQVDYDKGFLQLSGRGKEAEKSDFSPKVLNDFILVCRDKSCSPELRKNLYVLRDLARSHLKAAGWKLVVSAEGRKYYVSPHGKRFASLVTACEAWKTAEEKKGTDCTNIMTYNHEFGDQGSFSNLTYKHDNGSWKPLVLSNPVYCHDAVELYAQIVGDTNPTPRNLILAELDRESLAEKVKRHLLALGWKIEISEGTVLRIRFSSPQGRIYYSLNQACYDVLRQHQKENEDIEPEYLPEAITEYESYIDSHVRNGRQECLHGNVKFLRLNAKKHLLFMGWSFWYKEKKNKQELCYRSPSGSNFGSLITACKEYLRDSKNSTMKIPSSVNNQKKINLELTNGHVESVKNDEHMMLSTVSNPATSNEFHPGHLLRGEAKRRSTFACNSSVSGEHKFRKLRIKMKNFNDSANLPSLLSPSHDNDLTCQPGQRNVCRQSKRKLVCQSGRQEHRPTKRAKHLVSSCRQHFGKTVITWLIENDILLLRQKVYCISNRDEQSRKEGRITQDGIKCMCCRTVFDPANFAAHSGNIAERPSSVIFLLDGRSLLQCEIQLMDASKYKVSPHIRLKGDYSQYQSDAICSMCHDGGELILCDHCPSSFHTTCIGLEDVPEGKWFCPSCRCDICGFGDYDRDIEKFTNTTILYCDQCEREYHVGCLRGRWSQRLDSCPSGNWFCSNKCSEIFYNLHKVVGKSNSTSAEGLSWTILRWRCNDLKDLGRSDLETAAEHHSKLSTALDVLHECFMPIVEYRTQSDLVADIIFNKESELNRLNFWGFYTMLLEKGDEPVTVATFRVFGEKVAEMPFIGTRHVYRRKGMCSLLVTELEKLLRSLGVERLLLPAVPLLLETWKSSFGFTEMDRSERLALSNYTLLDFDGATMCQKLL
ncbi:hypothetical protein Cni_G23603 [Canna indica]|uniref:Uncharacterized protein n=1 Tax=Canna indica TaxID=4628 RepID=A0AAQ3L0N6_9LILI|nr:hypothetical protein Cni_G23603 [Canna indica]